LITPPVQTGQDDKLLAYEADNIAIASELGIQHFDAYWLTKNNGGDALLSDGTHLNSLGTRIMADGLKPYFQGGTTLPVHLLSFTATKIYNGVTLNWSTASEQSSSEFVVQRSNNGRDFTSIGSVKAAENSTSTINYSFLDANSLKGSNFYRIKINNNSGSSNFSKVVLISNAESSQLFLSPNPAKDVINVQFTGNLQSKIELLDMSGRLLKSLDLKTTGLSSTSLDISNLSPGSYILKVGADRKQFVKL